MIILSCDESEEFDNLVHIIEGRVVSLTSIWVYTTENIT